MLWLQDWRGVQHRKKLWEAGNWSPDTAQIRGAVEEAVTLCGWCARPQRISEMAKGWWKVQLLIYSCNKLLRKKSSVFQRPTTVLRSFLWCAFCSQWFHSSCWHPEVRWIRTQLGSVLCERTRKGLSPALGQSCSPVSVEVVQLIYHPVMHEIEYILLPDHRRIMDTLLMLWLPF